MIPKKLQNSFLYVIILLTIILHSLSCNYFTEPEPFVNKDAHPPEIKYKTATFYNYTQDQLVTGIIYPDLVPGFDSTLVKSTAAFVDSINVDSINHSYQLPFQFKIDTRKWSNGKHDIYFKVYKKAVESDSLGLLGLLYAPLQIYKTSLIFDNTPATAPANITVTLQNKDALIFWTPTNFNFFHSYIIRKNGDVVNEIYSQDASSYIDTTLPDFFNVYYEVGVSLKGQNTVYSDKHNFKQGETLPLFNKADFIIDNLNDEVIFNTGSLTAVSTQTGEIISTTPGSFSSRNLWAKSISNDTIYCWDILNRIFYTYNAKPLNSIDYRNISTNNIAYALAVGPDGKLYVSTSTPNNYLFIYKNFQQVSTLITPAATFESICRFLSVSPDGHTLLEADDKGIKSYSLDNEAVTYKFQSTIQDRIDLFRIDWNNSRLFIKRQDKTVELWDTQTLSPVHSYQLPVSKPTATQVTAIFANLKNLYVAYTINFFNSNTTLLAEYDINSQQLKHSWVFPAIVQNLSGSENGRYLFACTSTDRWIVDVGGSL